MVGFGLAAFRAKTGEPALACFCCILFGLVLHGFSRSRARSTIYPYTKPNAICMSQDKSVTFFFKFVQKYPPNRNTLRHGMCVSLQLINLQRDRAAYSDRGVHGAGRARSSWRSPLARLVVWLLAQRGDGRTLFNPLGCCVIDRPRLGVAAADSPTFNLHRLDLDIALSSTAPLSLKPL